MPVTRQTRCWPSSEWTTNPLSRRTRQDSPSSHRNRFAGCRREPCWEVIKAPVFAFFSVPAWGGITTLRLLWLCRNNSAWVYFSRKTASESGCFAPADALFPPAHSALWAFLHGGWYHYPRRAIHAVETLDAHGSRRLILPFLCRPGIRPVWAEYPLGGTHATPALNRAHIVAHAPKHRAFSPPETSAGSIGSTAWVFQCIVTFGTAQLDEPLAVAAAHHGGNADLLSAATLCRIRRDTFFGVMPRCPQGRSARTASVGVPINSARSRISSERRMTIWPPSSSGCVGCPTPAPTHFSALRSSVSSRYSMSRPM